MTLNVAMPVYFVDTLGLPGLGPGHGVRDQHGDDRGRPGARGAGDDRADAAPGAAGGGRVHGRVSFVMFYAADALSRDRRGGAWCWWRAVVYTLGEMTAGPVVAALSAETPPPDQRGRYMAATQLAWSASARGRAAALLRPARPRRAGGLGRAGAALPGLGRSLIEDAGPADAAGAPGRSPTSPRAPTPACPSAPSRRRPARASAVSRGFVRGSAPTGPGLTGPTVPPGADG